MTLKRKAIFTLLIIVTFCAGGLSVKIGPAAKVLLFKQVNKWDLVGDSDWDDSFSLVKIKSSTDNNYQSAIFLASSKTKPLLVSLHTWSGDFSQTDPLATLAKAHGWNYIHPDFRGPNRTIEACLSPLVISDIDDAIDYAIENSAVDIDNIFVVGVSGGGYAALGSYLKTKHKVKRFISWVPISDLSAWHSQSLSLGNDNYANDIEGCTSSLNSEEIKARSPLYWEFPANNGSYLDIFAGINDGHKGVGSVPISHSLLFFNRLLTEANLNDKVVDENKIVELLTRAISIKNDANMIGDRAVIYQNITVKATLTIFNGGHEMLPEYTFSRLIELSEK